MENVIRTRLRTLREKHNLSLRDLADKTNIHFTTLHKIELIKRTPTLDQTLTLADFFKVSLDYFLFRDAGTIEKYFGISIDEVERLYNSTKYKSALHQEIVEKISNLKDDDLFMVDSLLNRLNA